MTCCVNGISASKAFTQYFFGAIANVSPSLADRELFDFEALDAQREFDGESCSTERWTKTKRINMVNLGFAAD